MRCAILSDLHGNLPALEAILASLRSEHIDEIILAGDLISGCPYPNETLRLVRERNIRCIRGNHESYLLSMHHRTCRPEMLHNRQWGATRWIYQRLDPQDLAWIEALPDQLSLPGPGGGVRIVHGSLESAFGALLPDRCPSVLAQLERVRLVKPGQTIPPLAQILTSIPESVLICGHIHIPWVQREGRKLGLNPGSAGVPNSGDPRASYALLEWDGSAWQAEIRLAQYDLERVKRDFHSSGLLAAGGGFSRGFLLDLITAQNYVWDFVQHAFTVARARGVAGPIIPDEVWGEAERSFDWASAER